MKDKHLVIVRTGGSVINFESYNCQELGLAKSLSKKGLTVSLILAGNENKITEVIYDEYKIIVYQCRYISVTQSLSWFDSIEELLKKINPDIIQIHEFGMLMSWRVVRWAKKYKKPIVLIQGSYRPTQKKIFKQLELLFNYTFGKYILKNITNIGAKTSRARNYLQKYTSKNIFSTPVGLDISKFENALNIDWRNRLMLMNEEKIILYVGTIEPRRNPIFMLDVIDILPDNYILVVVGDGPQRDEFQDIINKKSMDHKCKFLGKLSQKELASLYSLSDIFMLVSDYEIYGMVLLEAMYFGLPVISTNTAGSESIIADGKDGIIMFEKSVSDWAERIKMLLEDQCLYCQYSAAAKNKIQKTLTWDYVSDEYLKLYSSAIRSIKEN